MHEGYTLRSLLEEIAETIGDELEEIDDDVFLDLLRVVNELRRSFLTESWRRWKGKRSMGNS